MKIIGQTRNEIRIEKTSSKGSFKDNFFFFLVVFFVFPIAPIAFFLTNIFPIISQTGVARVNCDRTELQQVNCRISQSKFLDLVESQPIDIKSVQSAKYNVIEIVDVDEKKTFTYNFQLINKFKEVKTFDSSQEPASKIVTSINSFLASQQTSLEYNFDDRTSLIFAISLIFVVLTNLFILYVCFKFWLSLLRGCSEKEIILNKSHRSFDYIQKRFILGTKVDTYKFTDVTKVDVLYSSDSYNNISFIPRINMISGVKYNFETITDRQVAIGIANNLNRFVGLPEEDDPVVRE